MLENEISQRKKEEMDKAKNMGDYIYIPVQIGRFFNLIPLKIQIQDRKISISIPSEDSQFSSELKLEAMKILEKLAKTLTEEKILFEKYYNKWNIDKIKIPVFEDNPR